MSERYTKLFALPENLYNENAPLLIAAGALLKDNETGRVLAQVKLKNISEKTIKAVKISVRAFDISGTELEGVAEYQYLDLSVGRDAEFGQKNAIILPDNVARSFSCECESVIFSDNTIWNSSDEKWEPLVQAELLENKIPRWLIDQYRLETVKDAKYVVTDDLQHEVWICTCGAINKQSEKRCHTCRSEKEKLIASLNAEALSQHDKIRKQGQTEIKETEEKSKRKRFAIIGTIATVCVALIITLVISLTQTDTLNGIWIAPSVNSEESTMVFALNDDLSGISLISQSHLYDLIRDESSDVLYYGVDLRFSSAKRENHGNIMAFNGDDLYIEFEKDRLEDGSLSLVLKQVNDDHIYGGICFLRLPDDTINKIRSGDISEEDFKNTFFNS